MKPLILAAAALLAAAGAATAQTTTTEPMPDTQAAPAPADDGAASGPLIEVEDESMMVDAFGMTVEELEDTDLYTADGAAIGEIEEVVMTADGEPAGLSADVGGFLGIGDREVLFEFHQVSLHQGRVVTSLTQAEIEALPDWD